jgi:hypothetical protein
MQIQTEQTAKEFPATTAVIEPSGYRHPAYAESLRDFGEPLELPRCGGWILTRQIPNSDAKDGMGCYPLFACRDWRRIGEDLQSLEGKLVSVALVTDPFGNFDGEELKRLFDVAFAFKEHFVCDISAPPEQFVSKHHRRYACKSLENCRVEMVDQPSAFLDEWMELYGFLARRHNLAGIKAFSRDSFRRQLTVPGLVMMRITSGDKIMGAMLWMISNGVAYAHLMAQTDEGYAANTYYGLLWRSIEIFRSSFRLRVQRLHLGGASGTTSGEADGMLFFKEGWSTHVRPAWFCGKILDRDKYDQLVQARGLAADSYFPLYRKGEF